MNIFINQNQYQDKDLLLQVKCVEKTEDSTQNWANQMPKKPIRDDQILLGRIVIEVFQDSEAELSFEFDVQNNDRQDVAKLVIDSIKLSKGKYSSTLGDIFNPPHLRPPEQVCPVPGKKKDVENFHFFLFFCLRLFIC